MADLTGITAAIERGDRATAVRLTTEAVAEGHDPKTVLDAMITAMDVVGPSSSATRSSSRRC